MKYAIAAGADFLADIDVIGPLVEDNFVVGIKCKLADGAEKEFRAKATCDASGIRAAVRVRLPKDLYNGEKLLPKDTVVCYREVRDLIGTCDYTPQSDYPGWYCILQNRGYFWIVPEGKGLANVGCGMPMFADDPKPDELVKSRNLEKSSSQLAEIIE